MRTYFLLWVSVSSLEEPPSATVVGVIREPHGRQNVGIHLAPYRSGLSLCYGAEVDRIPPALPATSVCPFVMSSALAFKGHSVAAQGTETAEGSCPHLLLPGSRLEMLTLMKPNTGAARPAAF